MRGPSKWPSGKESACQWRRGRLDSWVKKIPWGRKWQPTPVFLPEKSHGQRSLAGYSSWGCKESDTIEWLSSSNQRLREAYVSLSGSEQASLSSHMREVTSHLYCATADSFISMPLSPETYLGFWFSISVLPKVIPFFVPVVPTTDS